MSSKPFRDSQGRLCLDAKIWYYGVTACFWVRVRVVTDRGYTGWAPYISDEAPASVPRADLCERLRGMVFATVAHYGGPYRLRSKIR